MDRGGLRIRKEKNVFSEAVAQGELHASTLCQKRCVASIASRIAIGIIRYRRRIEAHGVRRVEYLPRELELMPLGDR